MSETENNNNNLSFEYHLDKAKEIVAKLESGDCDLDEMLTLYKDGVDSLKFCNQKLNEFEDKITFRTIDDCHKSQVVHAGRIKHALDKREKRR